MADGEEKQDEVSTHVKNLMQRDIYHSLMEAAELGKIGTPAVSPLMEELASGKTAARWRAVMGLARVGSPAVPALIDALKRDDEQLRTAAVWALAEIGDERCVDCLIENLNCSSSESCQALTAAALLRIHTPAAVAAVERKMQAADPEFQDTVSVALHGT
ncbi:hypothetical protein RJ53_05145 [Methanocalculus chunghsingensis]|uniref:PBS lyase HEAT domain protein repeat-containing protein n=1 Tax=Methanocalculus chunghsingensis TaxID=156457 RepID=A0A8J7W953_9EURY|nr:HEAT repeat domain-containing protein [Methanocalculus chunghsingensis]MBR1368925.1 hypothetical protein [Methanocalculus chunghsingensis]